MTITALPQTEIPAPSVISGRPVVDATGWLRRFRRAFVAVVKSAARLVSSLALIGFGAWCIWFHVHWLRLPDAVLMRDYPIDPTVTGTRDALLVMLGLGLIFVLGGLSYLDDWRKSVATWLLQS